MSGKGKAVGEFVELGIKERSCFEEHWVSQVIDEFVKFQFWNKKETNKNVFLISFIVFFISDLFFLISVLTVSLMGRLGDSVG